MQVIVILVLVLLLVYSAMAQTLRSKVTIRKLPLLVQMAMLVIASASSEFGVAVATTIRT